MFGRKRPAALEGRPSTPANQGVAVVPVFTPDPHGAAMFAGIVNGNQGHLGSRIAMETRGQAWHGWTAPPQGTMTGAANIGSGRPRVAPTTRFDQSQGVAPDSVQQAFSQRMAERRFS